MDEQWEHKCCYCEYDSGPCHRPCQKHEAEAELDSLMLLDWRMESHRSLQ